MALDPALPAKGFRHDIESEMGLAAGPVAGVAFVPMRFILDMEALGHESVAQLFRDQIACVHGKSMIPKSGNRFSDKIMLHCQRMPSRSIPTLAHFCRLSSLEGAMQAPA